MSRKCRLGCTPRLLNGRVVIHKSQVKSARPRDPRREGALEVVHVEGADRAPLGPRLNTEHQRRVIREAVWVQTALIGSSVVQQLRQL